MADINWADVTGIAPQLAAAGVVPAGAQTLILGYSNNEIEPRFYGGEDSFSYKLVRILYAAHFGEIVRRQGQTGIVTNKSLSSTSISVGYMAKLLAEPLQSTPYGEQIELLQSQSPNRAGFVA